MGVSKVGAGVHCRKLRSAQHTYIYIYGRETEGKWRDVMEDRLDLLLQRPPGGLKKRATTTTKRMGV